MTGKGLLRSDGRGGASFSTYKNTGIDFVKSHYVIENCEFTDGVALLLSHNGWPQRMRYHPRWRSFVHYVQGRAGTTRPPVSITAQVNGIEVSSGHDEVR